MSIFMLPPPGHSFVLIRYLQFYGSLSRCCLIREMMFRGDFILRSCTHAVWLVLMMCFIEVVFRYTPTIGDWDKPSYLFFWGTFFTLNAAMNCLFIGNLSRFSELIRTGSLDFVLLKPVDEQFLISCSRIDWALVPELAFGLGLSIYASLRMDAGLTVWRLFGYSALIATGLTVLYCLLLVLSACSVWIVRYQELYEAWFYLLQFASYPDDVYDHASGICRRFVLMAVFPILLAVNVPARYGAMLLSGWVPIASLLVTAVLALIGSRRFLRFALRSYCGASA
jgi:ABC-2 type transport system permease protein